MAKIWKLRIRRRNDKQNRWNWHIGRTGEENQTIFNNYKSKIVYNIARYDII